LNLRKQELKVIEQYRRSTQFPTLTGGHHLMTARSRRSLRGALTAFGLAAVAFALVLGTAQRVARAGEEDDLQREIDTQRVSVADLERLDEQKATGDEIAQLRSWLDEAWSLRSKHEYDQVREVLERTRKQADLIRAKITASKLRAQAMSREASLNEVRAKIARTKKALSEAMKRKKALEGSEKIGDKVSEKSSASGDKAIEKVGP
jgi:hypothetical protein